MLDPHLNHSRHNPGGNLQKGREKEFVHDWLGLPQRDRQIHDALDMEVRTTAIPA